MDDYDHFAGHTAAPPFDCTLCGLPMRADADRCESCGTLVGEDRDEPERCNVCDHFHIGPCAELAEGA